MIGRSIAFIALLMFAAQPARAVVYDATAKTASILVPSIGPIGMLNATVLEQANSNFFGPSETIDSLTITITQITTLTGALTNNSSFQKLTASATGDFNYSYARSNPSVPNLLQTADFSASVSTNTITIGPGGSGTIVGQDSHFTQISVPFNELSLFEFAGLPNVPGTGAHYFFTINSTTVDLLPDFRGSGSVSTNFVATGETDLTMLWRFGGVGATAAIPEPSTWAMMLVGFAGLGIAAYRRVRIA